MVITKDRGLKCLKKVASLFLKLKLQSLLSFVLLSLSAVVVSIPVQARCSAS